MKSEWRVTSNSINGEKVYGAYRLKDINAVDHSGNRENARGYFKDRETAVKVAEEMNKIEEETICI